MNREALAEAYALLGRAGLIAGSSGNLSVRDGDGMLISATGITPGRVTAADFVATNLDTPCRRASSEWAFHAALYRARPELQAIVHTHADACTALACLNEALPAFHYDVASFGGADVRCAPYVTFGTLELATHAVAAMADRTACLLGNHGMIAAGPSLGHAVAATFQLERLCRQYLLARSAGTPRLLTATEMATVLERFSTYQQTARLPAA